MLSVKRICNTEEGCTFSHIVLFLLREPRECLVLRWGRFLAVIPRHVSHNKHVRGRKTAKLRLRDDGEGMLMVAFGTYKGPYVMQHGGCLKHPTLPAAHLMKGDELIKHGKAQLGYLARMLFVGSVLVNKSPRFGKNMLLEGPTTHRERLPKVEHDTLSNAHVGHKDLLHTEELHESHVHHGGRKNHDGFHTTGQPGHLRQTPPDFRPQVQRAPMALVQARCSRQPPYEQAALPQPLRPPPA